MPSPESLEARKRLHKEQVDQSVSLDEERAGWDDYAANLPLSPSVKLEVNTLAGVECAILTPPTADVDRTIVYAHGGGLTTGSILTHRAFASELSAALNTPVVLPQYRLLPENPPDAPIDDLIGVYLSFLEDPPSAKHQLFLGGDSSGAGLAITAMTKLRDENLPLPAACFSISGAFDATLSSASIRDREDRDPVLSESVLRHWQTHFGRDFDFADPRVSPLFASLSNLSPMLLLVGEDEVWFDDSARMYQRYIDEGSSAEMIVFDGMWHVWPMTAGLPETREAFEKIKEFLNNSSWEI